jgi:hypothetical protein
MLLAKAERRLGIADRLARMIPDGDDTNRVVHLLPNKEVINLTWDYLCQGLFSLVSSLLSVPGLVVGGPL